MHDLVKQAIIRAQRILAEQKQREESFSHITATDRMVQLAHEWAKKFLPEYIERAIINKNENYFIIPKCNYVGTDAIPDSVLSIVCREYGLNVEVVLNYNKIKQYKVSWPM